MKTSLQISSLGLLLVLLLGSVQLNAEESTEELAALIDRLSQRVPAPAFHQASTFQTPSRHGKLLDLSIDGSRMVLMQADKKISTWNVDEGKKLAEFAAKEGAHNGILKISRDGKWVAFASQKKWVEVWDVETGKLVYAFDEMPWKIDDLGFSQDSELVYASGTQQQLWIAKRDGEIVKHQSEPILAEERRVRVCNFGQDCWATVVEHEDTKTLDLSWETPEGKGQVELPRHNPPNIVGGPTFFCVFSANEFFAAPTNNGKPFHSITYQMIEDLRIDSLENTNQANYLWMSTGSGVEIRGSWRLERIGQMIVPRIYEPQVMLIPAPNTKRMISHEPNGQTTVYALDEGAEIRPSAYRTITLLESVMKKKRYDAIEAVGKMWETRPVPITEDKFTTAYSELVYFVREYRDAPRNSEEQAAWLAELVEKYPENDVFRLALASKYHSIGTEARGSGIAISVTPEGWNTLDKYMQKCWEIIEPMLEREHVPPETFVEVVFVARYQGWSNERLEGYLDRALKEAPTYPRIWKQASYSSLPRWGGEPGDTEALAARVADHVGGKEGDMIYADVARQIHTHFDWQKLVDELGFDKDRLLRGTVGLCERAPDTNLENEGLLLARHFDDHPSAHKIATLWKERNHTYVHRLWKWDLDQVKTTLAWALADEPPMQEVAKPENPAPKNADEPENQ